MKGGERVKVTIEIQPEEAAVLLRELMDDPQTLQEPFLQEEMLDTAARHAARMQAAVAFARRGTRQPEQDAS